MLIEIAACVCLALFLLLIKKKYWITCTDHRKKSNHRRIRRIARSKMDYICEPFQKYQYMPLHELSAFIIGEFDFILGIFDRAKRSMLTKPETVQKVYNLACILWQSQESFDLTGVLKDDTHDALVNWIFFSPPNGEYAFIKFAVARLLCSMCSIKPDLYDRLLTRLNILNDTLGSQTPYIFRHLVSYDIEHGGDLEHLSAAIDLKSVDLTENMLKSLSIISLSFIPAYKLIHSKFLDILIDLMIDFISKDKSQLVSTKPHSTPSPSVFNMATVLNNIWSANNIPIPGVLDYSVSRPEDQSGPSNQPPCVSATANNTAELSKINNVDSLIWALDFFADLCWQNALRTWICSERNTILWENILQYLCIEVPKTQKGTKYMLPSNPNAKSIRKLEESAVNFFAKCGCGHSQNQEKFAEIFSRVLNLGVPEGTDPPGMSDFTRRVLLEFIFSPGHMYASIETDLPEGVNNIRTNDIALLLPPPAFPTSKRHQLLYLNVDRSCADILKKVKSDKDRKINNNHSSSNLNDSISWENCLPSTSKRSPDVSPVASSSKRSSDNTFAPYAKRTKISDDERSYKLMFWAPNMYQFINVSQHWSLAEILQVFVPSGDELEVPVLKFLLSRQDPNDESEESPEILHLLPPPAVQRFLNLGGFKYIALNLEKKLSPALLSKRPHIGPRSVKRGRTCALNQISIHTLMAIGQFSRLPEYRNNPDTKSVLQSILGVGKETNFNSDRYSRFFTQDVAKMCNPLMVLPFELLRLTIFRSYKNAVDMPNLDVSYAPAIDFVLMYLAVYSHQGEKEDSNAIHENQIYLKAIRQCYLTRNKVPKKTNARSSRANWPQGVGYSTNADMSKEVVDFSRILEEEELITTLLMVLGNYTCPDPIVSSPSFKDHKKDMCEMQLMRPLPSAAVEQISNSCLLQVMISHLKNDSVFDMVKHIPLYKAIMFVVRAMVSNIQLAPLILNILDSGGETAGPSDSNQQSIPSLITKLRKQIEEYLRRTRTNDNPVTSSSKSNDETDCEEIIFFEDVLNTSDIIDIIKSNTAAFLTATTNTINQSNDNNEEVDNLSANSTNDYIRIMKNLQFDEYEMITERPDGTNSFNVPYHFHKVALQPMVTIPSRMKRLAMEMSSLSSSLPISRESAIFVRHDESRIDVIKVLITGPAGTPYMNGCFEFDIFCPNDYPNKPIKVNFQTTGSGSVRFNPNLYNCGKVCLSLLNTWSGEQWNPQTSSILQVLVSIQGMILIPEPYFNEPGWEGSRGTHQGQSAAKTYNDNLLPHTIRYAMINQINSPSACFQKIIHTHFYLKRHEIKAQVAGWINQSTGSGKQMLQTEARRLFAELDGLTLPA